VDGRSLAALAITDCATYLSNKHVIFSLPLRLVYIDAPVMYAALY